MTTATLINNEYLAALKKIRLATQAHNAVVAAYRARTINDEQFLASLAAYKKEEAEFDAAYAIEAK